MASAAGAETRTTVDVSVGSRAATNPFLINGSSTDTVSALAEVKPTIEIKGATSSLTVDGAARLERYFQKYGTDVTGTLNAAYVKNFSDWTKFDLTGRFVTSRGGSRDLALLDPTTGTGTPTSPTPVDVTAAGSRFRQYSFGGAARISTQLSDRDLVSVVGGVDLFQAENGSLLDYRNYSAGATYARIVSDQTQLGLRVDYSKMEYTHQTVGNGDVISPTLTAQFKPGPTWLIVGSVGASFASIELVGGAKSHTSDVVGEVVICNDGIRTTTCVRAKRNVQATALGGVSTLTSGGFDFSWKMGAADTLTLYTNYSRVDQPASARTLFGRNRDFLFSATINYARRLSERLFLDVTPQFDKLSDPTGLRDPNYGVLVSLRYRFGQ